MANVVVVGSVNLDFVVRAPHLPAPGETVLGGELRRDDAAFWRLLEHVDVLVVNETEALGICPRRTPRGLPEREALALELTDVGSASTTVVTLGSEGAVFAVDGHARHQGAFPVTVVDSTGAGDAFCGALATSLAHATPFPVAVRFGCAAGALATRGLGPQRALPTTNEVEELLAPVSTPSTPGAAR